MFFIFYTQLSRQIDHKVLVYKLLQKFLLSVDVVVFILKRCEGIIKNNKFKLLPEASLCCSFLLITCDTWKMLRVGKLWRKDFLAKAVAQSPKKTGE